MFDKLIDLVIKTGSRLLPFTVVNEYEMAIRLRLGRFASDLNAGLVWKIPLVDLIKRVDGRVKFYETNACSLVTKDGVIISAQALMAFRPTSGKTAILSHEKYGSPVWDGTQAAIANCVQSQNYSVVVSPEFTEILHKKCASLTAEYGIEIVSCRLKDAAKSRTYRLLK